MNETGMPAIQNFRIVSHLDGLTPEILEELQDEMEDLDEVAGTAWKQVKVPGGGGLAFELWKDEGKAPVYMNTLDVAIVLTHRVNAYWPYIPGDNSPLSKIPECSSMDGKTGVNSDGECIPCISCPYNRFGSAIGKDGPGKGKACKNMRRLYFVMDSDPELYMLSVPPTSAGDVNKQLNKALAMGKVYGRSLFRLSLERAENAAGKPYSKVNLQYLGPLPAGAVPKLKEIRARIKGQYKEALITLDDYMPSPIAGPARAPGIAAATAAADTPAVNGHNEAVQAPSAQAMQGYQAAQETPVAGPAAATMEPPPPEYPPEWLELQEDETAGQFEEMQPLQPSGPGPAYQAAQDEPVLPF